MVGGLVDSVGSRCFGVCARRAAHELVLSRAIAFGAAIAAVLAALSSGGLVAVVAVLAAAVLFLLLLRPIALRHRRSAPSLQSGTAALVGRPALVVERIANREGVGTVKIGGEVWAARAYDDAQVIDGGEQVEVVEIRSATALVMP